VAHECGHCSRGGAQMAAAWGWSPSEACAPFRWFHSRTNGAVAGGKRRRRSSGGRPARRLLAGVRGRHRAVGRPAMGELGPGRAAAGRHALRKAPSAEPGRGWPRNRVRRRPVSCRTGPHRRTRLGPLLVDGSSRRSPHPQACTGAGSSNQCRVRLQNAQTESITGTSTRTPTTVARAAPEPGP